MTARSSRRSEPGRSRPRTLARRSPMARFFEVLLATPAGGLGPLSRYIVANGWFYLAVGLILLVAPQGGQELAFQAELGGHDAGFVHVIGMTVAIIGFFYVIGGRTGSDSFALATVVDRLLVPFVLIPLA